MNSVGCVPIYWNRFAGELPKLKQCNFPSELKKINEYILQYKQILLSYDPPCVDMQVSTKFDEKEDNEWGRPCVEIFYTNSYYLNIQNEQTFGFESFLSGVGGFIGIFLGYSILQIPELLGSVLSFLRNINIMGTNTHGINPNKLKRNKTHSTRKTSA